jgi:hypothetical protein
MPTRPSFCARTGNLAVSIDCVGRPVILAERIVRMSGQDRVEAPAVCNSPALSELREYALRAPHLSFGQAMRSAMVDALEGAVRCGVESVARETASCRPNIADRRGIGDV